MGIAVTVLLKNKFIIITLKEEFLMNERDFPSTKTIIKRSLILWGAVFAIIAVFFLISHKPKTKEWTYELLEEEFGGIVEVNYAELRDCLKLLSEEEYMVCGYIRELGSYEFMGHDISHVEIADSKMENKYKNNLYVGCKPFDLKDLSVGDFVYAKGTFLAKVEYAKNDYSYQINADGNVSKEKQEDKDCISVTDFYNLMDKIYDDTLFKVTGLIIKDGDRYYLYQSEEAYKESKYNRIDIEFSEEQNNLNGKNVTIIGRADTFSNVGTGLIDCSIAD